MDTRTTLVTYLENLKHDTFLSPVISDGLWMLAENQRVVSLPVAGAIPSMDGPTKDAIRSYSLALMIEIAEFVQTLDWKPWKTKSVDPDRVVDEFADILAFLGVILLQLEAMGITPGMLARGYTQKSIVNIERFLGKHGAEYDRGIE
jgi:hypothetical protein